MTKSRGIRAPRTAWTEQQVDEIRRRYPHEKTEAIAADLGLPVARVYSKAAWMRLAKTPEYMASPEACRLRRDNPQGVLHRFPKGHVPANKGVKGISYPGTEATQFKPGQKPHTWKPIGTERYSKEGYLQRKMADTGCTRRDYVPVHHLIWKEAGRYIPQGHALAFKDGNKANITLDNLELVSRADLMKRNSYHNYPKEVAQLIQLRGAVQRQINKRSKQDEQPT
ncbi:MAG: HNH endonuclease signature motif containing protein [Gallionellaceae bacterium]